MELWLQSSVPGGENFERLMKFSFQAGSGKKCICQKGINLEGNCDNVIFGEN